MYRIIGGDQQEYGPITADDLRRWIGEGRLSGQSLVQAEGAGEWRPLSAFPEFTEALRAQAGQMPLAGPPPPLVSTVFGSAEILTRQPEVQIGRCLAQSWALLTANFGLLFGATALVWAINLICQFIPLVGGLVNWLIHGVLYGGLYLIFLNRIRARAASIGEVFAGFSFGFVQLMLVGLLTELLSQIGLACCLVLPGLYLFVAWVFSVPLVADRRLEFWSAMELSRKVVTRVWFEMLGLLVLAFLPAILTYIFVKFRIACVAFPAVQSLITSGPPDFKHLLEVMTHMARISVPLTLLFEFVLLLNLPFGLGALMYAYENVFGTRTTPTA